ncbi:MAG TPA: ATP-binding protein [Acidimicrobiales bacterium]|nr:ATP-binding protein [Acidimicrobiales bacterium]
MDKPGDHSSTPPTPTSIWWVRIAGAATVLVVGAACAWVLGLRVANGGPEPEGQNWWLVTWLAAGMAYSLAGVVLVSRPRGRVLGACLLLVGLSSVTAALAVQYRGYEESTAGPPRWAALADADTWARPLGAAVLVALVPWTLAPAAWRRDRRSLAVLLVGVAATAATVAAAAAGWRRTEVAGSWLVGAVGLAWVGVLGANWWRQRRMSNDPLAGWLFAGAAVAWLAVVPDGLDIVDWSFAGRDVVWALLFLATVPLLVVGTLISELRRAPSGAERPSHRTLEWTLFAAGIVVIYTVAVAGLGRLVGGSGPTWLLVAATGAMALAIEPARQRIRHLVDRLVFGSRDDPMAVVQHIVDQVGETDTADDLLAALVRSLDQGLRFDAIAIDLASPQGGWERGASVGGDTKHRHEVILHHRTEVVGRLVVGWDEARLMRAPDRQLLAQLAGPLSLAVSWLRLTADLRRSNLAVVSAREEERRRLRRDLHDGVGPTLTGVSLGLRTSVRQLDRTAVNGSPYPSRPLLNRLADEVDGVVLEIKRIVRDLRPTALDQLGLMGAVAEFTRKLDDDIEIHLSLPPAPGPLPAAVEVTAYRIVTEALTNVVRHAHADHCWLTIETDDEVEIDVIDDGVGIDLDRSPGVGLTAMRERAAALGGAVRFVPDRSCGTHLHVQLPAALP